MDDYCLGYILDLVLDLQIPRLAPHLVGLVRRNEN